MELDITDFFERGSHIEFSASNAELNCYDSGERTWQNTLLVSSIYFILDTEAKKASVRAHLLGFGAWHKHEIYAWADKELNAVFLQLVAGDIREAGIDTECPDWAGYADEGLSNLYVGIDGRVYYTI